MAVFVATLAVIHLSFGGFFYNAEQVIGDDYSYFLPLLLEGEYWRTVNGWFSIPWFSPAQCAGTPAFPNPQNMMFSLPQWLTAWFDPLLSVYLTFLGMAALGFWGFYWFCRRILKLGVPASLFGAVAFALNGLFIERMLVGHFTYQVFMLIPWMAGLLLGKSDDRATSAGRVLLAGALWAYMLFAGALAVMPLVVLSLLLLGLWVGALQGAWRGFLVRFGLAGMVALGLAASKVSAMLAYLFHFPRDYYPLPGFTNIGDLLASLFRLLFFEVSGGELSQLLGNAPRSFSTHDFAVGITVVPLILLLAASAVWVYRKGLSKERSAGVITARKALSWLPLSLVALLPIAVNLYHPGWYSVLKATPFIKNSSNLFSWFGAYITLVLALAACAVQRLHRNELIQYLVAVLAISGIFLINAQADWSEYEHQRFPVGDILNAYTKLKSSGEVPAITRAAAYVDGGGRPRPILQGNTFFVFGASQILCYEPIFGYRQERFPFGPIRMGPVEEALGGGVLNFKNPACFVYPTQNNCRPGDHFRTDERDKLRQFVQYRPFPFEVPYWQRLANGLSVASIGALLLFGAWRLLARLRAGPLARRRSAKGNLP